MDFKTGARIVVGIMPFFAFAWATPVEFYVSPKGNDEQVGTKEQPLASLAGARDAIRKHNQARGLPEPITVHFFAGTYFIGQAVEFDLRDSGTTGAPIIYQAEAGATVRLTGGREVTGWKPANTPALRQRLPIESRGNVNVADLRASGITDFGKIQPLGFGLGNPPAEAELFFNDNPMTLARWPNEGFRGAKAMECEQIIIADTDRVGNWADEPDPWVFAYWKLDWAEAHEPLKGVDAAKHALLRREETKTPWGVNPETTRWYADNLLSELDAPGEYYIDRTHGWLYFLPPSSGGRTVLSVAEGLIHAKDLCHVTFRGFTFEACRGTAVVFENGAECRVTNCTIRNTGLDGVRISGGNRHEVYGCDVYATGSRGIVMGGGHRPSLTPAYHNVENNHVHHYSRRARTYQPGISTDGVGNRIAHNLIHDGPHMALAAAGNDNIVEYNEIHNVVGESGDAGAYYCGADWTQRGTIIRYNYFHDIVGATGYGGMTIYLDDQLSGQTIHGNLFDHCMQPVFIGGGSDNLVTNNVFIDCMKSAHLDDRGMNGQKAAAEDPQGVFHKNLQAMPYNNELWKSAYPTLANILEDDPGVPKRNVFARNICAGGTWDDFSKSILSKQTVENNLVHDDDAAWVRLYKDADGKPQRLKFKSEFSLKGIEFLPLPLEKMGLMASPPRATWPVVHQVRTVVWPKKK